MQSVPNRLVADVKTFYTGVARTDDLAKLLPSSYFLRLDAAITNTAIS
jgi:hypothetical protein